MSLIIDNVNVMKEVAELWFELVKTQAVLELLLKNQENISTSLTAQDIQACEDKAFTAVKNRFPTLPIRRK